MHSRHVLVTGGAGYIGSHTAKALAASGFMPVVLDDISAGSRQAVRWGPLIEGDIADESLLRSAVREFHIDAVLHLAASAYVGESMQKPGRYFHNNVTKSLALLDTLIDCGIERFIFASSCALYGLPQAKMIGEDHPLLPINPYGETKLFVERACHWYEQAHQLRSVCLRFFNAAGADPQGELGELHHPETHLIPLAIGSALGSRSELVINGTDFDTPDGTAIRDFIHVSDIASALVRALQYLDEGGASTRLNLGRGEGASVLTVIQKVEELCQRSVRTICGSRRPGDPAVLVARADRARAILGWEPAIRDLESIIATSLNWEIANSGKGMLLDPALL